MGTSKTWLSVGRAVVALSLVLLVGRLALDIATVTPVSGPVWPLAVLAGCVLVGAFLVVSAQSTDGPGESDEAGVGTDDEDGVDDKGSTEDTDTTINSIWNAIPSWQYGGRYVESGGLTRDEQEQTLAEIQEQAVELERENDVQNQR